MQHLSTVQSELQETPRNSRYPVIVHIAALSSHGSHLSLSNKYEFSDALAANGNDYWAPVSVHSNNIDEFTSLMQWNDGWVFLFCVNFDIAWLPTLANILPICGEIKLIFCICNYPFGVVVYCVNN